MAIGGILILLAGIFFFYIRPRQRRDEYNDQGAHGNYRNKEHKAELSAMSAPSNDTREVYSQPPEELDSTALRELGNTPSVQQTVSPLFELEGTKVSKLGRFEEDL